MNNTQLLYSEKQRFRQLWLWLLVFIGPVLFAWFILQQIILNSPAGNNPANDLILLISGGIFGIGLPFFIYLCGLDTEVRSNGVYVRFRPFHRKSIFYSFKDIKTVESVTYSPIKDYGGWGIRYGKLGKAYNVSGNKGVHLKFRSGQNLLIGSQQNQLLYDSIINHID